MTHHANTVSKWWEVRLLALVVAAFLTTLGYPVAGFVAGLVIFLLGKESS